MFYSQFILAKKGPLGTIWIAAHLERKLRKNQVADTDIGVSVDSILFPDVPIALRLSSHLLLGVVRIYSKKVNYLFHDCSETLLKIKQAFRSTAVDLPPEESTAPYHSITLPETFDLDDFELPDNGLFEGNFVDQHISSREQITLQDTLNSMSYSTSQFGADERFGDGDASQLGLDIDESLFADKVQTPMDITDNLALEEHGGDSFLAAPATTLSEMDIDGPLVHDDMQNNSVLTDPNDALPTELIEAEINGVETSCLVKSPSSELAQAPSTPGLLQEAIPATYHDGPTLSPLRKLSSSNVVEGVGCDDGEISHLGDDPDSRKSKSNFSNLLPESVPCADQNDVRHDSNLVEFEKGIQNIVGENSESLESPNRESDTKNLPLDNKGHPEDLRQGLNDVPLESITQVIDSAVQSTNDGDIAEGMEGGNSSCHILLPCSSGLKETDVPHGGDDEFARAFDSDNVPMDKQEEPKCSATERNTNLESPHPGESSINADLDKLDDAMKDNHLETLDCETSSNIQLPESFVSAPPSALETPNVMVPLHEVEVTTETEKDDESLIPVSGKKRKVMETTPTLGNGDLANLSELPRLKTSADFIPGDDDVLASILVGRKTPSLKLKPTPVQEGTTASKRSRINPRVSQSKRKVLVDDAMVMHGDVIRQQLTHTEDIRRVRRKAPCSQIEIWLIENSHLEEEMFTEPLFSGVSSELCSVVSQIYKVIETKVLKSGETTLEACIQQDVSFIGISDRNNEMAPEPSVLSSHTEKQDCNGGPLPLSTREDQIGVTDSFALSENETGLSLDLTGAAIDVQDLENADNAACVDPEMDNISGPLNGKVLAEMLEVVTDLDVEKIEARADVVPNSEEEKTEFAAHINEPMNDASIVIDEKVEVPYDGHELSLVQEVCNGGTSVDTSSGVEVPKDVGNENDHTQRVPMEVDLSENLVNVEETFKESEPPALSCPNQCEMDSGMESLDKGESQIQEVEEKDEMGGQNLADTLTNNLSPFEIHTEFLNLDDEAEPEPVEEEDNYTSTEQDRFFENSGWSSRTRAVARYLKSLFDNEDGHGRKLVAVDNLLAGKTRKEASRMFFETLVLKTKDYIQVQQDNSFGNINIKPRGKLAKSDFLCPVN